MNCLESVCLVLRSLIPSIVIVAPLCVNVMVAYLRFAMFRVLTRLAGIRTWLFMYILTL